MSYDDTLSTDTDKVRALIGDTSNDASTELLTDDHIEAVLALQSSFGLALAFLATELAVRYAQQPGSVTLPSGLSVSWASRVSTWLALAASARSGVFDTSGTALLSFVTANYGETNPDEFAVSPVWITNQ